MANAEIWRFAGKGAEKLRGRAQTPDHVAKRIASARAGLAAKERVCVRCGATFTPSSHSQRYCNLGCWTAGATARRAKRARVHVSATAYAALLTKFGTVCMICGEKPSYRLAVDHCHTTGRIRGLLCHRCNTAIGLLRDSPELLAKAAHYLNEPKE